MLEITIPGIHDSFYNEETEEFIDINVDETKLQLEHSLVSLSKWEEKWKKAFLGKKGKTYEEILDYIQCMTLTKSVDPKIYGNMTQEILDKIIDYISDPMTATTFNDRLIAKPKIQSRETVTAEVIYYWMVTLGIPQEYENWHLNKLLTLIKVINVKQQKPQKMNPRLAAQERARLNAERRAAARSKG